MECEIHRHGSITTRWRWWRFPAPSPRRGTVRGSRSCTHTIARQHRPPPPPPPISLRTDAVMPETPPPSPSSLIDDTVIPVDERLFRDQEAYVRQHLLAAAGARSTSAPVWWMPDDSHTLTDRDLHKAMGLGLSCPSQPPYPDQDPAADASPLQRVGGSASLSPPPNG